MSATVKQLREWLATLPADFDDQPISSIANVGYPFEAKRVIAFRWKETPSQAGVAVNSLGTHYSDDWKKAVEFVSVLQL